jgi:hypothetical protein
VLLDEGLVFSPEQSAEVLAVDEALERLAKLICKRPTFSAAAAASTNALGAKQLLAPALTRKQGYSKSRFSSSRSKLLTFQ